MEIINQRAKRTIQRKGVVEIDGDVEPSFKD